MTRLERWTCLEPYSIEMLTGESCGLSYRLLCDLTDDGKRIVEKALGVGVTLARTFRYGGTAGDRNVHRMSGRVQ